MSEETKRKISATKRQGQAPLVPQLCAFGITIERYNELLAEQGGVCAICGQPPTLVNYRQSRRQGRQTVPRLVVDHDHETGKIRGLLCVHCNRGIGFLKDDADIVRFALKYLEERG
jgi:hypothetical protein